LRNSSFAIPNFTFSREAARAVKTASAMMIVA